MPNMESITEAVLRFQEDGKNYRGVFDRISLIIYNYPDKISSLSEEDKCDFFLSFYNRIEGLIRNFSYRGLPFETLLFQTLKWHSKTFMSTKKEEKKLLAAALHDEEIKIRDLLSFQSDEEQAECRKIILKGKASRKRLLYLVLMDSPNIRDSELLTFSKLSGYDYEWLLEMKDKLNRKLHERSRRLTELREKRNHYFTKLRFKQLGLADETDKEKREQILKQISKLRKRLDDTRYEISRVPFRPTHGEVAELLNIPKGTVDSGLHYFRKNYNIAEDDTSYSLFL